MEAESVEPRGFALLLIIILSAIIVGNSIDVWLDGREKWWTVHTMLEFALIGLSAGGLVYFWRAWRRSAAETTAARSALATSQRTLAERQQERDRWRASAEQALSGLARAIDDQFDQWALTPAEREVAVGILQGLGHKQIAGRTGRSERTVRQHAVAVYGKAQLGGRAELAAFFLQDLTLPSPPAPPALDALRQ